MATELESGLFEIDPYEDRGRVEVTGEQLDEMAVALNIAEGLPSVIIIG